MPLQATSGAASYDGFGGGVPFTPTYIEDVFSTWLYTGTGAAQTITNGIDLAGKGGMIWLKNRSAVQSNAIFDTARGENPYLESDNTNAQQDWGNGVVYNSNGFTNKSNSYFGGSGAGSGNRYTSWTFRKQAKFFDVVTWTGNGASNRAISHSLGSTPGCIIVKVTSSVDNWVVQHRSLTSGTHYLILNRTQGQSNASSGELFAGFPTSNQFFIGNNFMVNGNGQTYVAYLFAHDAGGFGLTGTDNVISCGSYTGTASTQTIELGYEPQWLLIKNTTNAGNWLLFDNVRSLAVTSPTTATLFANTTGVESSNTYARVESTGFTVYGDAVVNANGNTFIYIAIRRGPMKTPTDATKVFMPTVYTGTNVDNRLVDTTIAPDMVLVKQRDATTPVGMVVGDRLRGNPYLLTGGTAAENSDADSFMTPTSGYGNSFSEMNGVGCGNDATSKLNISTTSNNQIAEAFKRAPGFFDVVCYTGDDVSGRTVQHNLGVAPDLVFVKCRNAVFDWYAYGRTGNSNRLAGSLNNNWAFTSLTGFSGFTQEPTSQYLYLSSGASETNGSGNTYVAYLFGTVAGVSKVGTYAGTGTTLQINCGFTGGARLVLIKRLDSGGNWFLWDSGRGISSGNDPYVVLNDSVAEVTNTDYINTYSAGFEITSTAPVSINNNGGTYIFLAIA